MAAPATATRPPHTPPPGRVGGPAASSRSRWAAHATPYVFLLPGMVLFIGLMLYPMVQAFRMSLYEWNILPGAVSEFVGVANYGRAFDDPVFWTALVNSTVYMLVTVPTQMALGMAIAVLLNQAIRGRVAFRVLFYLPVVTSWVVVSLLFKYLFNTQAGLVNYVLVDLLGVLGTPVAWLQDRWTAMATISLLGIWKGMGWSMLIFLAGLQGIPADLLEAAEVDGASKARRFFAITLPLLRPVVVFVTIMLVIGGFNVFISVFLITGGGPANQTEVLLTQMYEQAFSFLDFGYGAAIAYLLTALIFGLSFLQMRWADYGEETGA